MILPWLGSQCRGEARSTHVRVINYTPTLIITDGFVGVCCSSLKKICGIAKKHCLDDSKSIPRVKRNTANDDMVMPYYRSFPVNA